MAAAVAASQVKPLAAAAAGTAAATVSHPELTS